MDQADSRDLQEGLQKMSKKQEVKSGFGNCEYLQFTLFASPGKMFFCKKKKIHKFECEGCPYKKARRLYK